MTYPLLTAAALLGVFILLASIAMVWAMNHDRLHGADLILKWVTAPSAGILFIVIIIRLALP